MSGIGLNLRCSYKLSQGQRKYMEDVYVTKFLEDEEGEAKLAFFAVYDGHGGRHAAEFAKQRLLQEITSQELFWSHNDDDVLKAIKIGFSVTHQLMWKELENWPKTWSGRPSTAGTTASVGIIRDCKLYIGHVGDSAIVLGSRDVEGQPLVAKRLTEDHKPESPEEKKRIEEMGGNVFSGKSGVLRVVWNRPEISHKGPITRRTQLEKIPFLAVARSLGDLWSYNYSSGDYAVSPEPDLHCMQLDPKKHVCLILGSDGLWNMMSPQEAVHIVEQVETEVEQRFLHDPNVTENYWINPSTRLVDTALARWHMNSMRADNTTAITVMIDPYGPRKSERLMQQRKHLIATRKKKKEEKVFPSRVEPVLSKLDRGLPFVDPLESLPTFDEVDGPAPPVVNPESQPSSSNQSAGSSPRSKPYALTRVSNMSPNPVVENTSAPPVASMPVPSGSPHNLRNKSLKSVSIDTSASSAQSLSSSKLSKNNAGKPNNDTLVKTNTDSKKPSAVSSPSQKVSPDTKLLRNHTKSPKVEGRSARQNSNRTSMSYTCENSVKSLSSPPIVACKTIDGDEPLTPRRMTRGLLKDNANHVVPAVPVVHEVRDIGQKEQSPKPVPRVTRQTPSRTRFTNIKRKIADTPSPNLRRKRMKVNVK
ncbi:protein phosphatase 1D-like [Lineus longissimus]|uniref:protein phosphatase 1D-like n=1 Tax=Lineus longissimus TaxID=88925 RepID=UPI002B4DAE8F